MKLKQKLIICSLGMFLMITSGCFKQEFHQEAEVTITLGWWDGETPFDHQINSYLSTDWEDDEITMFITDLETLKM